MKKEEWAGSAGASPGPKTAHVAPVLLVAQNVSRIAGLAGGCADGMEISQDVNRAGVIRVLREVQALAEELLPTMARSAPNPSSGEGPSPSTPDRTTDVTHPHPGEGRP